MGYFEVHGCTGLYVTEFEEACCVHAVGLVESPQFVLVFWEFGLVGVSAIELQVVIEDVDGFMLEQSIDIGIFVDHISKESFLDIWVPRSITHSGVENDSRDNGQEFETPG